MPLSEPQLATPADGAEISRLHALATADSPVLSLIYGSVSPSAIAHYTSHATPLTIARRFHQFVVIRDPSTNRIISYVDWVSPYSAEEADDEEKEFREKIALLREKGEFPVAPEGMNKELSEEFGMKFGGLRKRLLGDPARKHYLCANIATDPTFRKQGAASALMRWPFEEADRQGVICYLDTDPNGVAIAMYKKLGFVQVGEGISVDLEPWGGKGVHRLVGMIREPAMVGNQG